MLDPSWRLENFRMRLERIVMVDGNSIGRFWFIRTVYSSPITYKVSALVVMYFKLYILATCLIKFDAVLLDFTIWHRRTLHLLMCQNPGFIFQLGFLLCIFKSSFFTEKLELQRE